MVSLAECLLREVLQKHGNAYERVPSVVQLGQDDAAVTLAPENGADGLHFLDDVDLSYGGAIDVGVIAGRDVLDGP